MKKLLLVLFIVLIVATGSIFIFIPTTQYLNYTTSLNCNESGANRFILNKDKWQSWWPGQKKDDTTYLYKNYNYRIDQILLNGFEATIYNDKGSVTGNFTVTALGRDQLQFMWNSVITLSTNPLIRIIQYYNYRNFKSNVENLISNIKTFFEKEENIYGTKVIEQKVTDSSLISVKRVFSHYPSTEEIYSVIQSLKDYVSKKGGEQSNPPMLNVHVTDSVTFETMVAIPTKSDLPSEGKFQLKKMVLGNILMAEVKGGISSITKEENELNNYVTDHKKVVPAIPYQSLVTNRLLEPDSSKWVTRLYYPIYY